MRRESGGGPQTDNDNHPPLTRGGCGLPGLCRRAAGHTFLCAKSHTHAQVNVIVEIMCDRAFSLAKCVSQGVEPLVDLEGVSPFGSRGYVPQVCSIHGDVSVPRNRPNHSRFCALASRSRSLFVDRGDAQQSLPAILVTSAAVRPLRVLLKACQVLRMRGSHGSNNG